MYTPLKSEVVGFLEKTKKERENRQMEGMRQKSAVTIQRIYRGFICRKKYRLETRHQFEALLRISEDGECKYDPIEVADLVKAIKYLRYHFNMNSDKKNLEHICRQLLTSIDSSKASHSYISMVLKTDTIVEWIRLTNWILKKSCECLKVIDPAMQRDSRLMNVILTLTINFLTVSRWKIVTVMSNANNLLQQLAKVTDTLYVRMLKFNLFKILKELLLKGVCRQTVHFSQITLNGVMSLILRIFQNPKFTETYLEAFIIHILSVPALIKHMNVMANEIFQTILKDRICTKIILHLHCAPQNQVAIFSQLQPSYSLCIIANVIDLGLLEMDVLANHGSEFCTVLSSLLVKLNQSINDNKTSSSHYHHIFGWSKEPMDENINCSMIHLRNQLKLLWSSKMIRSMFDELYDQPILDKDRSKSLSNNKETKKLTGPIFKLPRLATSGNFWKKLHSSYKNSSATETNSVSQIPLSIQSVCMLYFFTTNSLSQIRDDILAGVSLTDLPARMWRLIQSSGSVRQWANIIKDPDSGWYPQPHVSHLLHIFVLISKNLFIILDDMEVFEMEKVFTVSELIEMADFFNQLFIEVASTAISETELKNLMSTRSKVIETDKSGSKEMKGATEMSTLYSSCYSLLMVLFERDIRHPFTKNGFWLSNSIKPSQFMADLKKNKFIAKFLLKYVPHIISHKERVILFHEKIKEDKARLGLVVRNWNHDDSPIGAIISVRRQRMVEDGYDQLMKVNSDDFKKKIRVRFINELGMDEVGIDLDGVFKEFLEETIKTLLNPSLNLFCTTSDNRLYPSPLSGLYEQNHLLLFQYLGRMMAKAIYEEILIESPFANFFLTQVLRKEQSNMYSFIDELNTLDKDLYKSLTYVKHYEGDVSDLELTFSYDEDRLGKIETHDLRPGGRYMTVTNDTKISYVHMVARFRMFQQIRDQTRAFINGFYSIIQKDWFDMFSVPEMLKLICGDTGTIDIDDLKQNVRYSGGFHAGHRVIIWLWDILKNEFSEQERSLFLKFVTSCSKPPLLGFSYLEPTFSIRCVHSSDEDQEAEDTVGSLLKNIFSLSKKRNDIKRLPSAATCFNLLKLPNYESKSTLREKLRYVINSGAGFELS